MSVTKIVNTTYGPVRGIQRTSIVGAEYLSFRGVPYAQKPIGNLRFKDPQPPQPWTTILDATVPGKCAIAFNLMEAKLSATCSEDCLFVNIYTKDLSPSQLKPVMVWIHGGAFKAGDCTEFMTGPDYLLQRDIVFVSVNYRLGALGFLTLEDPNLNVPGNAGLKDQTLALKWVRDNAQFFGGDPKNVTLFGVSAGAASVHLHLLSDLSKGLFDKAISQSGTALSTYSNMTKNNWASRLAKALGWNGCGGEKEIYECLKNADATEIVKYQDSILTEHEKKTGTLIAFAPCTESYKSEQNFLTKAPINLLKTAWGNQIPLIIGGTSEEGLLYYFDVKADASLYRNDESFENLLPPELMLTKNSTESKQLAERIRQFYYGNDVPSESNMMTFLDILSDKYFLHGIHSAIKARLEDSTSAATYFYRFNFQSDFNALRKMFGFQDIEGVCHGEELVYIFKNDVGTKPDPETVEQKIVNIMCDSWTNFAWTSDPNNDSLKPIYWDKVTSGSPHKCLNISNVLSFINNPEQKRMELWDSLYKKKNLNKNDEMVKSVTVTPLKL